MKLVFFRGNGIGAALIRWHSRSEWNHVGIWDPEALRLYEANEKEGVAIRERWWPSPAEEVCTLAAPLEPWQKSLMETWLKAQAGKGYDFSSVAKFVSRVDPNPAGMERRWFCSELAAEAFRRAGRPLLRASSSKVSPGMLHASPLLKTCPVI